MTMAASDVEKTASSSADAAMPDIVNPDSLVFVPPDGGVKAWISVTGGFLMQFCSFGYVNACGIFQYYYSTTLLRTSSTSALAWITTLQVFLLFVLGPVTGSLVDLLGPRLVVLPFSVLCVLSIFMLSLCKNYWQVMLAQGIAFGIGAAGTSLPVMVISQQWFAKRRGLAVGIVAGGSSFGGVIYPIMITNLLPKLGFASTVRWTGVMVGVLLLIANAFISSPISPELRRKLKEAKDAHAVAKKQNPLEVFGSLSWLLFAVGIFFLMWGLFAPLNYLPLVAVANGMKEKLAMYTISMANAGSTLGRILPGHLSDMLGTFNMMTIIAACSGILVLAVWLPLEYHPSNVGIIVFSILYGFVSGGVVSLAAPCTVKLCGERVEHLGTMLGGIFVAIAFGSLSGLPIEGAIKDHEGDSYVGLICFSGVTMVVGAACIAVVRFLNAGSNLLARV